MIIKKILILILILIFLNIYTIEESSGMQIEETKEINTITFMDAPSLIQSTGSITFIDNPNFNPKVIFEIIKEYYFS